MAQGVSRRALVTGGTGFVGSHLVERLLRNGYAVTCLVRDLRHLRWLEGMEVRLTQGDCTQPESLAAAVQGVSLIFHCAGLTKAKHARDYYIVNHLGTKNLLEACARYNPGIEKFILVSSQAAAGPSPDGRPVNDGNTPHPVSDYGRSKLLAEDEARGYKDRLPVVILRPSSVYGPRDVDVYELFRWASRGLTLEMTGGDRYLNLCYVEDLTAALLLSAEHENGERQRIFCCGEQVLLVVGIQGLAALHGRCEGSHDQTSLRGGLPDRPRFRNRKPVHQKACACEQAEGAGSRAAILAVRCGQDRE